MIMKLSNKYRIQKLKLKKQPSSALLAEMSKTYALHAFMLAATRTRLQNNLLSLGWGLANLRKHE
jgi:hypothetical protein